MFKLINNNKDLYKIIFSKQKDSRMIDTDLYLAKKVDIKSIVNTNIKINLI